MNKETIYKDKAKVYSDFWFCRIVSKPNVAKKMIEDILGVKVSCIEQVATQKAIKDSFGSRGVRFNVYVEGDDAIYDIEMQCKNVDDLGKRFRYYRSSMDTELLNKGQRFSELKKSYIIFICKYDYYKDGFPMYECYNVCRQNNKKLEDEAYNIILNTEYEPEFKYMVSSNIIKLLDYVRNSELPKDPSPLVMEMHREFESLKDDNSVWRDYMNSIEHDEEIRAEGKTETKKLIFKVAKLAKEHKSKEDIAKECGISVEEVKEILENI